MFSVCGYSLLYNHSLNAFSCLCSFLFSPSVSAMCSLKTTSLPSGRTVSGRMYLQHLRLLGPSLQPISLLPLCGDTSRLHGSCSTDSLSLFPSTPIQSA